MFECIMFALWVWEQRNPIARTIENRDANQLPSICHSSTKKWAQTQVSTSQQSKRDTSMDIIRVFKQLSSSSNQRYIFPVSWVLAMLYRKAVYQRLDRLHITQSHIAMFPNRPRHYFESWKGKKIWKHQKKKKIILQELYIFQPVFASCLMENSSGSSHWPHIEEELSN